MIQKVTFGSLLILGVLTSCAPKQVQYTPEESAQVCEYSRNVCREATEFQLEYANMPKEQQESLIDALNSYTEQCNRARKMCKESQK